MTIFVCALSGNSKLSSKVISMALALAMSADGDFR